MIDPIKFKTNKCPAKWWATVASTLNREWFHNHPPGTLRLSSISYVRNEDGSFSGEVFFGEPRTLNGCAIYQEEYWTGGPV